FMWKPGRKGSDHEIIGLAQLPEIWGVKEPHQIIDLLGLMGDSVDNIPGVPGIGPKTAQKLIADFGSVEALLEKAGTLKGKQKENLITYADQARLSKDLATIIIDAPIDVTFEALELSARDDEAVKDLFTEFEFRTLTKRLFGDGGGVAEVKEDTGEEAAAPAALTLFETFKTISEVPHSYHLAEAPEKQAELFAALRASQRFCFDIETTALDRFEAKLLGVAFSWETHGGWYLPYDGSEYQRNELKAILEGPAEKLGHNLKYDLSVLLHHGIAVEGPFVDTMLAHALVAPEQRHSMDYLSETLLGYAPIKLAELANSHLQPPVPEAGSDDLFNFSAAKKASKELDVTAIPTALLGEYAAEDADVTWQLADKILPALAGQERVFRNIECPLLPVLVRMEMEGISVDPAALVEIGNLLQTRIDELSISIAAHAGRPFNLNSPKQLGEILFNELNLADKAKKTKTGQFKTDEATLASLAGKHPMIDEILEYREATKLKGTYLDALPGHIVKETGRIHTSFHQLVAATGRLASTDPNLQNIPVRSKLGRQIRKAFVPRAGFTLLSCDYSQIELRIMAALAEDASMIEDFRNAKDIHTATSAKVWGVPESEVTKDMRSGAKMVNFGIIYGISAFGLSQRLGIPRSEAGTIIDNYFREYSAIKAFMDRTIQEARQSGYVETLTGRRRYFPDLTSGNQTIRGNAERAAINTPIQGSAADMIKLAMIRIDALLREKPWKSRMLLQVHDELVFDLALDEQEELVPLILSAMEEALPLPGGVPVLVEHGTGPNWLAAH
ncbi:MAG: polymerase, partial [Akkermansiaceae bacterium]|nr:polymerase [Akkermansiaceae bacterium]